MAADLDRLTQFRKTLAKTLQAELRIDFVDGQLEQAVERKDLGCTWPMSIAEDGARVEIEYDRVGVRIFKALKASAKRSAQTPYDPSDLETLAGLLRQVVAQHQTGFGPWSTRVTSVVFDVHSQSIDAIVLATWDNLSVQPF